MRTGSRSFGACSRSRTTRETTCSRRRGSTSTTCAGCAPRRPRFAHVTGGGIVGNLGARRARRARAPRSTGTHGSGRPCSSGSPRHVAEDELRRVFNLGIGYLAVVRDPGDDLVIGRIVRRDRRARVGRGDEPAGAPRRGPAGRRRRVERRAARRARAGRGGRLATAVFELEDYPDRDARDLAMADWLESQGVELVVCAGYMQLLRPAFLERFPQRVVNVHPAPLPDFPGPIRSRTSSRRVRQPRLRPSTSSTRASTRAR